MVAAAVQVGVELRAGGGNDTRLGARDARHAFSTTSLPAPHPHALTSRSEYH